MAKRRQSRRDPAEVAAAAMERSAETTRAGAVEAAQIARDGTLRAAGRGATAVVLAAALGGISAATSAAIQGYYAVEEARVTASAPSSQSQYWGQMDGSGVVAALKDGQIVLYRRSDGSRFWTAPAAALSEVRFSY